MELFCCTKRTRATQRKSLFPEHRCFGSTASALLESKDGFFGDDVASLSPESGHPLASPKPDAPQLGRARASSSSGAADDHPKASMPMPVSLEDKADPFLVNGVLDAERAATAQEFQAIGRTNPK
mmetsp:Transcript_41425/g.81899  ORF Transcript_41425/g.81899 Transcript_41425/m.81899 type:complete len:125 (+) Transcript_41425:44-418(+)